MEMQFDRKLAEKYHANTQIARVLTEAWVEKQMFCPRCGRERISRFPDNRPVADFYCPSCHAEYELKSKNGPLGGKINDGAYETMIQRITADNNPDFLAMSYSRETLQVRDLFFIPKFFFVPDIIEKRKPLSPTARRAGWTGCSILMERIPEQGKIPLVLNGIAIDKDVVVRQVQKSSALAVGSLSSRGWLMDVLSCVNSVPGQVFSLDDIYAFTDELSAKHPNNHNIQAKIRQQLQFLRDQGFLLFLGNGAYRKCSAADD